MRQLFQISYCLVLFCGAVLCAGTLFALSDAFIDTLILPKWYDFAFGLSLFLTMMVISGQPGREIMYRRFYLLLLIVVAACMGQAIYGILQFFYILPAFGQLPVTGSFDNPAGFASALCAGLPFALSLLHNRHKWVRYFTSTATPVIMAAVFLSHSRAGMISVGVIVFLWLLPHPPTHSGSQMDAICSASGPARHNVST